MTRGQLPGWSGAPAPQAPYIYASGNTVVTTTSDGQGTFSFGKTFPAAPIVTANGGNGENVTIVSVTTTGFTAAFYYQNGTAIASGPVRCFWVAVPSTT